MMKVFIVGCVLPVIALQAFACAADGSHPKMDPITCFERDGNKEYFDIFKTGDKNWQIAFRGQAFVDINVLEAYRNGAGMPSEVDDGCKRADWTAKCNSHYRNNAVLDNWVNVEQVLLGVIDGGKMRKFVLFNGEGSDYFNWFDRKRVIRSSWSDLTPDISKNIFGIEGRKERHFFINHKYGECPNDLGWFVAVDFDPNMGRQCDWAKSCQFPKIMYAKDATWTNWNDKSIMRLADAFVIFVKMGNPPM